MTGRGGGGLADAAGGPARHVPVLLAEVSAALAPERGGVFIDGTFGAGGYTAAILAASPETRVIAIDRDPDALAAGETMVRDQAGRLRLVPGRFGSLDGVAADLGVEQVAGVALDIGVSSMQLDEAERGFSFRFDGPLDMRMERSGRSAADIVNEAPEAEIADILFHYGEERRARVLARALIERRRKAPIRTTADLVEIVARHVRSEPGTNPATRTFQALRIAVNGELAELVDGLHAAERVLGPGGRLAIVTFHSLEDRIAKQFFAVRTKGGPRASRHLPAPDAAPPTFRTLVRGPVAACEDETRRNPRARSAKLRWAERTAAPAAGRQSELDLLAGLPPARERKAVR